MNTRTILMIVGVVLLALCALLMFLAYREAKKPSNTRNVSKLLFKTIGGVVSMIASLNVLGGEDDDD